MNAVEPPSVTSDWQETPPPAGPSRIAIYGRRVLLFLILIAMLAALVSFIWWLFVQPTTHLAVLRADGLRILHGPPVEVAGKELSQLELLENALNYYSGEEWDELLRSPGSMRSLSDVLGRLSVGGGDSFILYVAAHGVTYGGQAQLLCSNFDPTDEDDQGLFPIESLLTELKALPPKTTKLLILDAGPLDYDPGLGIVVSDFPRLLEEQVKQIADPNLWVLCSHSVAEKSHRSRALRGSVFGTFVALGLQGAAASAENDTIDPVGLSEFVRTSVGAWVNQSSAGQATQTPQLIRAGQGDEPEEKPVLLTVVGAADLRRVDIPKLIDEIHRDAGPPPPYPVLDADPRGLFLRAATTPEDRLAPATAADQGQTGAVDSAPGQASPSQRNEESDQTAQTGSAEPDGDASTGEAEDRRQRLQSLIAGAWRRRDELSGRDGADSSSSRAVDETPHLWRELQEELLAYEEVLAFGELDEADLGSLEAVLETALPLFFTSQEGEQDLSKLKGAETSPPMPSGRVVVDDVRSLAFAELAADRGWYTPSDNVAELAAQLKGIINLPPAEFSAWVTEKTGWEAHYDHYYELRLVKELSQVEGLTPSLYQLALQTRREGEQVAAAEPWCSQWLKEDMEAADRMRLAGERRIIDRIGSEWMRRAEEQLTRALDSYREAEKKLADIRRAVRLRNDLVFRAPYYVRWHRTSHARSDDDMGALSEFLDTLRELSAILDAPAGHEVARVNQLREALLRFHNEKDREVESLARKPTSRDAWRVDRLLKTPLPSFRARGSLLGSARYLDIDLANSISLEEASPGAPGDDWSRLVDLGSLEMKVAQLATWQPEAGDPFQDLQEAFADLQETLPTSSKLTAAATTNGVEDRWQMFTQGLREFYASLQVAAPQDQILPRAAEHERAIRGQRALQLMNARAAVRFRDVRVADLFARLHLHDMLAWHRHRFIVAQADAGRNEYQYLRTAADAYHLQALQFARSPELAASAGRQFQIESPELVSLMDRSERDLSVGFTYLGAAKTDAWVILQYDPDLIRVSAPARIYHEHELPERFDENLSNAETGDDAENLKEQILLARQYPYRPDLASHPASFRGLRNSDTRSLSLSVAAETEAVDYAQLVVKVIAPPRQTMAEGQRRAPALAYRRHPIKVALRTFDLVVDGDYGSWTSSPHELTLHPFPNRISSYRLGIVNTGEKDRNVTIRFMVPSEPVNLQQLAPEDIEELFGDAADSLEPITVTVPADGVPHPLGKADEEQPADAGPQEAPPVAAEPAADEEPKPPAGPPLTYGLLVEMSDAGDPPQKLVRHIKVVPQRPRRFVRPQVGYNSSLERIEIKVLPRDEMLLPAGPIKVECEIAEDLATGTEGKLHDVLQAPQKLEAGLFVNVPAMPPQLLTLYIHVDDYPRAFVYKVPCGGQAVGLPEATELLDVRLLAPETIDGYQAPAATTPIEIQVDAPVGSFEAGGDNLAIALDLDRDLQLDTESAEQFRIDRNSKSFLHSFVDGQLSLDTRVTDHRSPLRTDRLQNVHVNVLGRIDVGETGSDGDPLALNIDGAPPRIIWVDLDPLGGTVMVGDELEVTVWSQDNMSGVKSVQGAFDIDGTGTFAPEAELTKFVRDPLTQRWNAKFATGDFLGVQTLLVQATDRVGNASQELPVPIRVLTEQQIATVTEARPILLRGIVTHSGKPIPNARLLLTPVDGEEDAPQIPPATTNQQGEFAFLRVPPGVYNLAARGVVYNVPRRGLRELMIAPDSGRIVHADVELE